MRVAEGRHVHAEELELGGHVGAGELPGLTGERGRRRLGHLVPGRDQAVHPAVRRERALADGEHGRVGGAALPVDHDAAACADLQAHVPGELVPRPDARGEDDQIGREDRTVGQGHAVDRAGVIDGDLLGARARVDGESHALDRAQQGRAAALVDLDRHQPGRELHDVRGETESLERAGRLQAEQPAADDGTRGGRLGVLLDREQVLDGAVDEAALGVLVRHGRYEGVRAGGEDERVVGERPSGARGDRARGPVDALGRVVEIQLDAVPLHEVRVGEGEFVGCAAVEVRGQPDPVVGRPRLLAQHDDPCAPGRSALRECLEESLADHPVADDHDRGGGHLRSLQAGATAGWRGAARRPPRYGPVRRRS